MENGVRRIDIRSLGTDNLLKQNALMSQRQYGGGAKSKSNRSEQTANCVDLQLSSIYNIHIQSLYSLQIDSTRRVQIKKENQSIRNDKKTQRGKKIISDQLTYMFSLVSRAQKVLLQLS